MRRMGFGGLLLWLGMGIVASGAAQARQEAVEAEADVDVSVRSDTSTSTIAPVVVSGLQPGPRLWKVSRDGRVMWVLGTLTPVEEIYGEGIGIAIRKGEDELREKFNAAIQAIRENGKYKEINDKYFEFDVYGG